MHTVRHIPTEILDAIGSYLCLQALRQCVRVSRSWSGVFIRQLWKTIDDTQHAWPRILKEYDSDNAKRCEQDEAWVIGIFAKYGQHIQHLNLHWKVTIKAASTNCDNIPAACPNLKSLSVSNVNTNLTLQQEKARDVLYKNVHPTNGAITHSTRALEALTGPLLSPIFENAFEPVVRGIRTEGQQQEDWRLVQQFWLLVYQNPQLRSSGSMIRWMSLWR
ncbi:hypothetical protein BGW39_010232 [Mortierella sp. 14UC]|nr:hypothetical protein BGW39_010232 [Mortierella sp. 14UC]